MMLQFGLLGGIAAGLLADAVNLRFAVAFTIGIRMAIDVFIIICAKEMRRMTLNQEPGGVKG